MKTGKTKSLDFQAHHANNQALITRPLRKKIFPVFRIYSERTARVKIFKQQKTKNNSRARLKKKKNRTHAGRLVSL